MSEWIKLHAGVFTHPKTRRLAKRLSIPHAAAAGHMACLWSFTAEFAPDGDLSRFDAEEVEIGAGWDGEEGAFVAAATASGYLENGVDRLAVHDWMDWGGKMVERKAAECKRSADRRASAGRTEDDQSSTAGRPLAEREIDREKERTPPTPPAAPKPVDNSAKPERGCSIEHEEHEPEPPGDTEGDGAAALDTATSDNVGTCDGNRCPAHDFPASAFAPLRRAMLVGLHPEQQKEVGTAGDLDHLLEAYAAHVCAACQAAFGEFERPQRDGICEQAVVAAVANLHGSQDVAAVMKSRLLRFGLADLIGDRKLEELRRTKRDKRRKGEPVRIGTTLPAVERVEEEAS